MGAMGILDPRHALAPEPEHYHEPKPLNLKDLRGSGSRAGTGDFAKAKLAQRFCRYTTRNSYEIHRQPQLL